MTVVSRVHENPQGGRPGVAARYPHAHSPISLFAKVLTERPDEESTRVDGGTDRITRQQRAGAILTKLEERIARLRESTHGDPRLRHLLRAVRDGDDDELARLGIDAGYAWLDDVLLALVSGAPFVEIETVGPYAAHHVAADGRLTVSADNLPDDERSGILLAAIFRDIFAECSNLRLVTLVDDLNDITGRNLSPEERDRYVVRMSEILYEHSVLRSDDVPGRDYVIVRESSNEQHVALLVERLRDSHRGVIEETDDGDVIFRPTEDFVRQLAFDSRSRVREITRKGILVRRGGRSTCQALEAAGLLSLEDMNRSIVHVVMLDKRFAAQQDKTYALLRALGIVRQDTHHNVFYDAEMLPPELIALALCELLARELRRLIDVQRRYDDWESFGAEEYRARWYGERIQPVDHRALTFAAEQLAMASDLVVEAAADVGTGPNLFPALLIAPYVPDGANIDLIELSGVNRTLLLRDLDALAHGVDTSPWPKFEQALADHDARYRGALARLPSLCRVEEGSVFELPQAAFDIVTSFYVTESITTSRREFRLAIRSLVGALRPGGVLIVGHMMGSLGYSAGENTRFPALRLDRVEVEEAYRDADVDFSLLIIDEDAADKARPGYEGVAVVVARVF